MIMASPAEQALERVLFFPFIAPPNGGKGTQTTRLAEQYNMPRVDMGSLLRQIAKEDSPLGHKVQERLAGGLLVDLDTVMDVLRDGIEKQLAERTGPVTDKVAFILDGFPRNGEQTEALTALCEKTGATIASAIYLDVPYSVIEERAAHRRICADCGTIYNLKSQAPKQEGVCDVCGGTHLEHRVDDHPEKVKVRLEGFDADTLPILASFEQRGLLNRINGHQAVDAVTRDLQTLMDSILNPATPTPR
jgi:adenylate kinase